MQVNIEEEYDKIYRYCYYKVYNQQAAEDITQETFLRYFNQTTYLERGKSLAYLYTIAKNLCYDYYAKTSTELLDETAAADNMEDSLVTSIALTEALLLLSEDTREVLMLRYVNELSINEISKFLKISRFAVYRRINNGLHKLKALLREEDFY
ncbi:RNA polymerase sigma factor [Anaerocolumna sp. MB42-C2]|uniref:RNA polymerase sigma factor n=1 Tax=Anaerocolumna sp. MB42-C2 TaxID=3070997 RepID=UPI0027DEFC44|nr:RNA polymerase sigma factor [Anaerocolumna sp. MB42-C2]WMJ89955.1 RNA polymerase sigma factor [Anaerocolumna sp. MB42-C2]